MQYEYILSSESKIKNLFYLENILEKENDVLENQNGLVVVSHHADPSRQGENETSTDPTVLKENEPLQSSETTDPSKSQGCAILSDKLYFWLLYHTY